ncbi:MAG: hypothetical protein IV105_18920 [Rhizobacter sp.]|nr:hypothetical protein [Rhizobacter sp.]
MDDILFTLNNLSLVQMVLAWLFVASYALALGGMLGSKGSLRAGLVAALSAVLFSALSLDWVHGALLVVFAIGGMGLFVATSWLLTYSVGRLISHREQRAETAAALPPPQAAPAHPTIRTLRDLWRTHVAP